MSAKAAVLLPRQSNSGAVRAEYPTEELVTVVYTSYAILC